MSGLWAMWPSTPAKLEIVPTVMPELKQNLEIWHECREKASAWVREYKHGNIWDFELKLKELF